MEQKSGGYGESKQERRLLQDLPRLRPHSPQRTGGALHAELIDLSLSALREETWGDIFPVKVFLAQSNAPRLGSILKK